MILALGLIAGLIVPFPIPKHVDQHQSPNDPMQENINSDSQTLPPRVDGEFDTFSSSALET